MAWFGEKSWVPWIASLTTDISRCISLTHMIEFGFAFSNITNNLKKVFDPLHCRHYVVKGLL